MSSFISSGIKQAVKIFLAVSGEIQFCGSLALVLYGKLNREVKDLDMVIPADSFQDVSEFFNKFQDNKSDWDAHSASKDYELKYNNFKGKIFGLKFDLFRCYFSLSEYETVNFCGQTIKLQPFEKIIEMKTAYYFRYGIERHREDLISMGIKV